MDIWAILERAARLCGSDAAVVDEGGTRTYRELRDECASVAVGLRARGVRAGDRIAILAWNRHEYLAAYFAAAALRAILVPLNVRLAERELAAVLADSGARWLVADPALAELVERTLRAGAELDGIVWIGGRIAVATRASACAWSDLAATPAHGFEAGPVRGDDVAHLYYTSGTTGTPKGVMLTHRNVCVHALAAVAELELADTDVWAHVAPMFHLADAWASFAITWVGGRHAMLPRFEVEAALDLLEREQVTITNLVPTMLNRMVADPSAAGRDHSQLRCILSGGAPIAPSVVRAVMETFRCDYMQTYGMTETSPYLTLSKLTRALRELSREEQLRYKSRTGRPFAAVELRVVDADGRPVPDDDRTVGEIWVRGETVTPGYWNRPEETRAAFHDGWLKTGDLAVVDRMGYVDIVDRKKDMILTGGENVYSVEVEHVLQSHPSVLEVAVYGVPDSIWGERVKAAVVLRPSAASDASELQRFCREKLAGFKVPREFAFWPELPRTGSGKIQKSRLRDQDRRAGEH